MKQFEVGKWKKLVRKINDKNWTSRWKHFRLENWREKLKISLKFSVKILQFLQNCPTFSEVITVFPKLFVTSGVTWINETHWHVSGHNWTRQLAVLNFGSVSMIRNLSLQVRPHYAAQQNATKCGLATQQMAGIMWTSMRRGLGWYATRHENLIGKMLVSPKVCRAAYNE